MSNNSEDDRPHIEDPSDEILHENTQPETTAPPKTQNYDSDEDSGMPECEADKETQATYDQLMEHKRFILAANRDIAMLEVQSRELEDFVTNADDYKDDYFDIKQFASKVGNVWQGRLPPTNKMMNSEVGTSALPARRRIFPNQSSILDANVARAQAHTDQLKAADDVYASNENQKIQESGALVSADSLYEHQPGMSRRIARNEERRKIFEDAMRARNAQLASERLLEDAVNGVVRTSTSARPFSPPKLPPLAASMTGSKSMAHPSHLLTSADGTKVLGPKRPDAMAALSITAVPSGAQASTTGLNTSHPISASVSVVPVPALEPILSADFTGRDKSVAHRPPAVARAAQLAQQQALERKLKAQRAKAIEVFGEDVDVAENFAIIAPHQVKPSSPSKFKQQREAEEAAALPNLSASPTRPTTRLQQLLSEQDKSLVEQERRHQDEYAPMLARYYEYHDHAQQKLAAIAAMAGMDVPGERRGLLPSPDERQ